MKKSIELRMKIAEMQTEKRTLGTGLDKLEATELETRSAKLDELDTKINALHIEVAELEEKEENEFRAAKLNGNINKPEERKEESKTLTDKEVRAAYGKYLTNRPRTQAEKRALGEALTTTSTEFQAPTELLAGVNNGGVFIPKSISLDILRQIEIESPFLADIATTAIPGMVTWITEEYSTGANIKKEGECNDQESIKWGTLNLATGQYMKTIAITRELLNLAVEEFLDYVIAELGVKVRELLAEQVLYGAGVPQTSGNVMGNSQVVGATKGAIDGSGTITEGNTVLDIIHNALGLTPIRKRAGRKVYVSPDVMQFITGVKNDAGDFMLPPINGVGLGSVFTIQVVEEPFLKPGSFIIGNPTRDYKLNVYQPAVIGIDVNNKCAIVEYTMRLMVAGAPIPNIFVYGIITGV